MADKNGKAGIMRREDINIMAPVGSYESLRAAIEAGADSVYFGIGRLNMRARSSNNFTFSDLAEIVSICKSAGVQTYVAANTIIYDDELDEMRRLIEAAAAASVTAVIASDLSVIQYARKCGVEVHASTQLNISNIEAVEFFARYCDVMVTARELTLDQVRHITNEIRSRHIVGPSGNLVKIEIFCHGALCMAVSGKCYLSLHQYNYSANRGSCLQACRRSYIVTDTETGQELCIDNQYIMSPKDLCTIGFLDKIVAAGVTVIKIEGRARSGEYVKTVVECYDEALKAIANATYDQNHIDQWTRRLATVFNRGFWNGYYLGQTLGEWSHTYGSQATKTKVFIGKIANYFSNIGVAEVKFETNEVLTCGDEILIMGQTTGVVQQTVDEIRLDLQTTKSVKQGDNFSIPTTKPVRRGDKLYKLTASEAS